MPEYPGADGATVSVPSNLSPLALSKPGDYAYVWGALSATATQLPINDSNVVGEGPVGLILPEASIAVCLEGTENAGPPSVSAEIQFSAAPGAFNIQIQEADTDADAFYITPIAAAYTITAVNAVTFIARVDLSPTGGKFMRILVSSLTNNVKLIAKITRLS